MAPPKHAVEDCPQAPIIQSIQELMGRVVKALEDIAAQGAMVSAHEKRLDNQNEHIENLYAINRLIKEDITKIQLKHAQERGAEAVIGKNKAFAEKIKVSLAPYLLSAGIFFIWLFDKGNVGEKLAKLWHEFKG